MTVEIRLPGPLQTKAQRGGMVEPSRGDSNSGTRNRSGGARRESALSFVSSCSALQGSPPGPSQVRTRSRSQDGTGGIRYLPGRARAGPTTRGEAVIRVPEGATNAIPDPELAGATALPQVPQVEKEPWSLFSTSAWCSLSSDLQGLTVISPCCPGHRRHPERVRRPRPGRRAPGAAMVGNMHYGMSFVQQRDGRYRCQNLGAR